MIVTGTSDDIVEGGPGDDRIDAGDGNDYVADGPGSDVVRGGPGNDQFPVIGGGEDTFDGGDGDDSFFPRDLPKGIAHYLGGAGNDAFTAGTTPGTIDAGPGDDDISTIRDTRSYRGEVVTTVTCGSGVDLMTPGPRDRVRLDCDHLNHPDVYCSRRSCRVGTTLYSLRNGQLARDLVSRVTTVRGNDSVAWVPLTSRAVRAAVRRAPGKALKVELNLVGRDLYLHKNPRLVLIK